MNPPDPFNKPAATLNWSKSDPEQRLGFSGGRYTSVNIYFTLVAGILLTTAFYLVVIFGLRQVESAKFFCDMFTERGIIPYFTMLFFFWALAILHTKSRKLKLQRAALRLKPVPVDPDFILNRETARDVLLKLRGEVDDTRHFILSNRVDRALSNMQNLGLVSDVSNILATQAEFDEDQLASSYSLVNGFLWAIPVFGFIGTVLGLSQAIGAFGSTLKSAADLSALKTSLQDVTGGLSTAFETTLVALVCALIVQLLLSFIQGLEAQFLDDCNDYCHSNIVSKLKLAES
jgi:biopolymer transport protein ExbB/TolQ